MKYLLVIILIFNQSLFADSLKLDGKISVEKYFKFKKRVDEYKNIPLAADFMKAMEKAIDQGVGPGCKVKFDKPKDAEIYQYVCNDIVQENKNTKNEGYKEGIYSYFSDKGYDKRDVSGIVQGILDSPSLCSKLMTSFDDADHKAKMIKATMKKEISDNQKEINNACGSKDNITANCSGLAEFKELHSDLMDYTQIGNENSDFGKKFISLPVASNCDCVDGYNHSLSQKFKPSEDDRKEMEELINKKLKEQAQQKINQEFSLAIEDMVSDGIDPEQIKECQKTHRYLKRNGIIAEGLKDLAYFHSTYKPSPQVSEKGLEVKCGEYSKSDYVKFSNLKLDKETHKNQVKSFNIRINLIRQGVTNKDIQSCLNEAIPSFKDQSIIDFLENMASISSHKIKKLKCDDKAMFKAYANNIKRDNTLTKFIADMSIAAQIYPSIRQFSQLPLESSLLTNEWSGLIDNPKASDLNTELIEKNKNNIATLRCQGLKEKAQKLKGIDRSFFGRLLSLKKNQDISEEHHDHIDLETNSLLTNSEMTELVNNIYKDFKFKDNLKKVAFYQLVSKSYCKMSSYSGASGQGKLNVNKSVYNLPNLLPSRTIEMQNSNYEDKMMCGSKYFSPFHEWAKDTCVGKETPAHKLASTPGMGEGLKQLQGSVQGFEPKSSTQSQTSNISSSSKNENSSSNSTPIFNQSPSDGVYSQRALNDYSRDLTTQPYSAKDYIKTTKKLSENEKEKSEVIKEYSDISKKSSLSSRELKRLEELESRFKKLETENSRLRNQISSMSREKDAATSNNGTKGGASLRQANKNNFQEARNVLENGLSNPKKGYASSAAAAKSFSNLSGRQLSSLAYQVAGNNELIEPVRIKVNQPVNSGLESLISIIKGNNALDDQVRQAIIQKRPIIISDGEKEIEIEYGSEKYIRIAKEYKLEIDKVVEDTKEKGGRSIASEIQKNYQELLNNSMSFLNN